MEFYWLSLIDLQLTLAGCMSESGQEWSPALNDNSGIYTNERKHRFSSVAIPLVRFHFIFSDSLLMKGDV